MSISQFEKLTDKEARILLSDPSSLELLLVPIKNNPKKYSKYDKLLGNKERNSVLVKNNLPKIAIKLFYDRDEDFVEAVQQIVDINISAFKESIARTLNAEVNDESLASHADDFYNFIIENKDDSYEIDYEFFWVRYKLCGVEIDEEKRTKLEEIFKERKITKKNNSSNEKKIENEAGETKKKITAKAC